MGCQLGRFGYCRKLLFSTFFLDIELYLSKVFVRSILRLISLTVMRLLSDETILFSNVVDIVFFSIVASIDLVQNVQSQNRQRDVHFKADGHPPCKLQASAKSLRFGSRTKPYQSCNFQNFFFAPLTTVHPDKTVTMPFVSIAYMPGT